MATTTRMSFAQVQYALVQRAGARIDIIADTLGVEARRLAPALGRMRRAGLVMAKDGRWWTCQFDAFETQDA